MSENTRYLCINCKQGFNHLPPAKLDECISGHEHVFIKRNNIITREKREKLVQAYLFGKRVTAIFTSSPLTKEEMKT
jgi:BRCT domain type II-containing protein